MKRILMIIGISILSIFVMSKEVFASSYDVNIGNEKVSVNETKEIYGGEVKLEGSSGNYILTLKNINLDEVYDYGSTSVIGIYFPSNLTIKLEGNNTISSTKAVDGAATKYSAITIGSKNLNIIGNGTLTIKSDKYNVAYGILANKVEIGSSEPVGPTLNIDINVEGTDSKVFAIQNISNITNSTIKVKGSGNCVYGLYSNAASSDVLVKSSDININTSVSDTGTGIYVYSSNLTVEDSEVFIKSNKIGTYDTIFVALNGKDLLKIKDSKIVALLDNYYGATLRNSISSGVISLEKSENKDFMILSNNGIIETSEDIEFTNINNKMVYVSDTSLDTISQNNSYDIKDLVDEHYFVISSGVDNKIESGNEQTLDKNKDTSYSFKVNHFRYLVKNVKLDDTNLTEDDYEINKDGTVSLKATGLTKLYALDLGNHSVEINYYFGNKLTLNLKTEEIKQEVNEKTEEVKQEATEKTNEVKIDVKEENPKTGDNIITSIVVGSISFASLVGLTFYYKKKNI